MNKIKYGCLKIWHFSSRVQHEISLVLIANSWDIELNTRREVPFRAHMYSLYKRSSRRCIRLSSRGINRELRIIVLHKDSDFTLFWHNSTCVSWYFFFTHVYCLVPFSSDSIYESFTYDQVKTSLSESKAVAQEPTYYSASSLALRVITTPSTI